MPDRPGKPRQIGLTMVMDKGLSLRQAEDFMSVGSHYTDFVKLGFGTSLLTPGVGKKIKMYTGAGVVPYLGGTLFEAFIVRKMFDEFVELIKKLELTMVEISDGSYDLDHGRKLEYINKLSQSVTVISEVGSKKKDVVYTPEQWVSMMKSELEAGSVKVIAEARESGTIGIFNDDGSINKPVVDAISSHVKLENVIWEAPMKSQQAWFIKHFGPNVNLGNIPPEEIIPLESLRVGLRGDTFFQFLPDSLVK
ncbi:MAG TPA: phosphosulfolactate synthase [Bacteroidales bacterium]|nr:phosphosulfolactate synthase [Bacteroidales bacterium]HRT88749.1 phosphosulfolactate synthase [Bacteroidales bacterium]